MAPLANVRSMAGAAAGVKPEERMKKLLNEKLEAEVVEVKDVSGGCGDFYQVLVVSPRFAGLNTVKQHRAVNAVLEADIGKMHGLTLKTMDPAQWAQARAAAGDKA